MAAKWLGLGMFDSVNLYSLVTEAELWAGARPSEHQSLEDLFRTLNCVPIDRETGRHAGSYIRQYGKSHSVELADALTAAGAKQNHAKLWTRNRKHYPMKDLTFFD